MTAMAVNSARVTFWDRFSPVAMPRAVTAWTASSREVAAPAAETGRSRARVRHAAKRAEKNRLVFI